MNVRSYADDKGVLLDKENVDNAGKSEKSVSIAALFFCMLKLSMFTFGGGFVMISLMQKEFAEKRGWLSEGEMQDITVIAQSSPGSIAVNAAVMLGYKLRGASGIAASVLGTICPPLIILTLISIFYTQFSEAVFIAALLNGMRAGVAAIVLDVALTMCLGTVRGRKPVHILIMIIVFAAVFVFDINAVLIITVCVLSGITATLVKHWRKK